MRPKAVFLDFDGVVLESVEVKTRAMRRLFSDRPEHVDAIVRHHVENSGVSRYEKFRHYYAAFFREPLTPQRMSELDRRFGELIFDEIMTADFVPGAREFLERSRGRIPLFVVSATPEAELERVVEARGLARFFRSVHGSPLKKAEHVARLLAAWNLAPEDCLFVGDAKADQEAAAACGVPFVQRLCGEAPAPFPGPRRAALPDLRGLSALWEAPAAPRLAHASEDPGRVALSASRPSRWTYLGSDALRRRAWERELGPGWTRLPAGATLQQEAARLRRPYLDWLAELGRRHAGTAWWVTRIADENTMRDSLFTQVCRLGAALRLLEGPAPAELVVCESEAVLDAVAAAKNEARRADPTARSRGASAALLRTAVRWTLFATRSLRALAAAAWSGRGAPPAPGSPSALVLTWAGAGYFGADGPKDAYFGRLAELLEARGWKVAVLPWLYGPGRPLTEAMRWLRRQARPHLVIEDFLTPRDYWDAAALCLSGARLPDGEHHAVGGLDISALVRAERARQAAETAKTPSLLYRPAFARMAAAGWSPTLVTYTFENAGEEKATLAAVRAAWPAARTVGFQHWTAPFPMMLQHFAAPDGPLPDVVACNSPFVKELFMKEGFPAARLAVGPSLRYEGLLAGRPRREPEPGLVFVALSLEREACAELLESLVPAAALPGVTLALRPHPMMPASDWGALEREGLVPKGARIAEGPAAGWLERCACAVVSGSTAALEYALMGVPVIVVGRDASPDLDPLAYFPEFPPPVRDAAELRARLREAAPASPEAELRAGAWADKARSLLLSPVNDRTLSVFTSPLPRGPEN